MCIRDRTVTDFCPIYCTESGDSVVSQLDKDDVEKIGLVKFDFLGLRTLTILDRAVEYIRQLHSDGESPNVRLFSLETLPLDDAATYALTVSYTHLDVYKRQEE